MNPIRKRQDRLTETVLDDEVVIMRVDTGEFFSLDAVGSRIWTLIDGVLDRDDLVHRLIAEFDGDPKRMAGEVDSFLDKLGGIGLIEQR